MAATKRKVEEDSQDESSPDTPKRRSSGRVRKVEVKYEESHSQDEDSEAEDEFQEDENSESDEDADDAVTSEEDEFESDASDEEIDTKRKKKGVNSSSSNGRAKFEEGQDTYSVDIPMEKPDGGVPYEDGRIHQNTLDFLRDIKKNNNREWLKWHDKVFRQAEKDFYSFVSEVTSIVSEKDPTVPELPVKDVIFRIYRDVRFSKDPTPYKTYFSVAWSRTGRKGPYAHYYLHLAPNNNSFLGGGYWDGESTTLSCLREDIDQQPQHIKSVLTAEPLREMFFPTVKKDEKKIISAFCSANAENALKTRPKGFDKDHENIELLKLKNFTLKKKLTDVEIMSENILEHIASIVEAMEPFISYLNGVVMPDT